MYHPGLMLFFSLLAFQLTTMCWAHDPTSTTDMPEDLSDPSDSYDVGLPNGDITSTSTTIIDYSPYPVPQTPTGTPTSTSVSRPVESAPPPPRENPALNSPAVAPQPFVSQTTSTLSGSDNAVGNLADESKTTLVVVESSTTLTIVTDAPQRTNLTRSNSGSSTISETQSSIGPAITCTCDSSASTARKGLPAAAIGAIVGSLLGATFLGILFVLWFMKRKGKRGFNKLEDGTANNPPAPRNGITPFILQPSEPQNLAIPNSKQRAMQEALRPISPLTSPVTSIGESWTLAESILSR